MAFDGAGTYSLPVNSFNPAVAATDISPTDWNSTAADLATALSTTICKDGQTVTTAKIPFAAGISVAGGSTFANYATSTVWTPSLGGNTTYNSQSGRYIRIGNLIIARFFLDINAIGTGSATAISGLPVASNATLDGAGSTPLYFASLVTSVTSLAAYVAANSSLISFSCLTAAAASMTLAPTLFQNSSQIKGQVIYEA